MLDAFAQLPFLPAGQGPLILVYGGLVVLGVAVPWSILSARSLAASHGDVSGLGRPSPHALREATVVEAPRAGQGTWVEPVTEAAVRARMGPAWVMSADAQRAVVLLTQCQGCSGPRHGCDRERRRLLQIVRPFAPQARVREVACNRRGACSFEIRRGRT